MALDALRASGGTVRLQAPVAALAQDADGVTVTLGDGERLTADWVIGCDGGRSTVRKTLAIDFEGYTWP